MKNRVELTEPTITGSSYAGAFAGDYIAAALLSANTLDAGGFEIMPNVKFKAVLKRVATSGLIQNAGCDYADLGTVTLTEKVIQPESFKINVTLCKQPLREDWEAVSMGYSAYDSLPPKFTDFVIGHIAAQVAEQLEQTIWSGTDATAGEFDGIETQLAADADLPAAQEITGAAITSLNVAGELADIVAAIPNQVYGKEGLKLYVSVNIAKAYIAHLGGYGASGLGGNGFEAKGSQWYTNGSLSFDGVPIFMANGMTADTAVCTYSDNLVFATGLLNDTNTVKLIDTSETLGDDNVRVIMKYTAAATYKIVEDVVTYGITNAVN